MNNVVKKDNEITFKESTFKERVKSDFARNKELYLIIIPVIAFYIIFQYTPMYGAIIAFKDYSPAQGIMGSPWVGLKHFQEFFSSYYFLRILKNTLVISLNSIIFGFPAPIILALLINELRVKFFSRLVQTITYLPHFISLIVICGLIKDFTSDTGVINYIMSLFGIHTNSLLNYSKNFVPIYIISDVWQGVGWGSIIYLAALMGIDQEQYEAAAIDGAGKLKQIIHITLPGILPTIMIMLILRMGNVLNVGFEKIILLYNPAIYNTSDVISSFVYRKGLLEFSWSYSSAVGLFNSSINFIFLVVSNWLSKKFNDTSLW